MRGDGYVFDVQYQTLEMLDRECFCRAQEVHGPRSADQPFAWDSERQP